MSDAQTHALDELDRRGRSAALALRARIDALVDDGPAAASPADDGLHLVRLDGRRAARRRRLRGWLVAAAVLAVVAAAAAIVVARDDRPTMSTGEPRYLVPGWLPDGYALAGVNDLGDTPPAADDVIGGQVTVYGDPDADDPWARTIVVGRMSGVRSGVDGEPIAIGDHPATIVEPESGSSTAGWQIEWPTDGGTLLVGASAGLDRRHAIAAAEAVEGETIDPAGLPDGFTELAQGPVDAVNGAFGLPASSETYTSGLALVYGPPGVGDGGGTLLSMVQRPGRAASVDLIRLSYTDSDVTTVQGEHAVVGRRDGVVVVQWLAPGDLLVSVAGLNVPEADVVAFAEGLRAAEPGEVERLLAERPPDVSLGPVPDGMVEAVSGTTSAGSVWRVTVRPGAAEGLPALEFEQASAGSSVAGSAGSSAHDTGATPPPLEMASDQTDGDDVIVYGVAAAEVATVAVEGPGRPPVPLDLVPVEGWTRRVFAAAVTADDAEGAAVVARSASGQELQRVAVR